MSALFCAAPQLAPQKYFYWGAYLMIYSDGWDEWGEWGMGISFEIKILWKSHI